MSHWRSKAKKRRKSPSLSTACADIRRHGSNGVAKYAVTAVMVWVAACHISFLETKDSLLLRASNRSPQNQLIPPRFRGKSTDGLMIRSDRPAVRAG